MAGHATRQPVGVLEDGLVNVNSSWCCQTFEEWWLQNLLFFLFDQVDLGGGERCCSQHLYPVEFVHCGWQHYCAGWCNSSLLCACVRWCSCVTTACWWWVTLWKKHSSQPPTSWQPSTRRLHWPVDQCLLSCTVWYSDASVSKYVWKYIYLYVFTQPVDGTLGLEALCFQVVCSSMCACNCHLCFYAVLERGIL